MRSTLTNQLDIYRCRVESNSDSYPHRYRFHFRSAAASLCLVGCLFAAVDVCHAQMISDNFDDGDADGWVAHKVVYEGLREVTNGAYRLATVESVPVGDLGHIISRFESESPIGDGYLRAKVSANTQGTSAAIAFLTDGDSPDYYVFNGSSEGGGLNLFRSNGRQFLPNLPDSDLRGSIRGLPRFQAGDEWWLELGVVDGLVSVKAWQDGTNAPREPQFSFLDANPHPITEISLAGWISTNWPSPVRVDATFDDVTFTPWVEFDCNTDGVVDIADANCSSPADLNATLETAGLILGDLDGNGAVEFEDFLTLSQNFAGAGNYTDGDLDLNGTVEFADFLLLSSNFGESTAVSAVPEPTGSIGWIAVGFALVLRIQKSGRQSARSR